jgi:Putative Ig domain
MIETDDSWPGTDGFQYQWMVNDVPIRDQTGPTLIPNMLRRGDRVTVDLVPVSGTVQGTRYQAGPVVVGNTPPVVAQLFIERPDDPHAPVFAKMEAVDADQDDMQFDVRWWHNNKIVKQGQEQTLDTTGFQPKDMLEVEVTPRDHLSTGKPVRSESVHVGNSPPRILSTPTALIGRDRYEYTVKAVDADGDPLSFLLETAPPGMVIDKDTGRLVWQIPSQQQGSHQVRIVAEDGQGGKAFQEFHFTLPAPVVPAKPEGA